MNATSKKVASGQATIKAKNMPLTQNTIKDASLGGTVPISHARDIAILITSAFEGTGYDRLEGNFDGQGFIFGLLGFCLGQGSLQKLIAAFYKEDAAAFHRCCTVHVPAYRKTLDLTATLLGVTKLTTALAVDWAVERQKKNEPDPQWSAAFQNLGREPKFQAVQRAYASALLYGSAGALTYCTKYEMNTVRGLALFFDCKVQQGSLRPASQAKAQARLKGVSDPLQRMEILAQVMSEQAKGLWAKDVLSRRLCIARGNGQVHGKSWDLDAEFGLSDVPLSQE
jgi:hypothetical protein